MAYFTVIIFTFISLWNWQEPGPLYSLKNLQSITIMSSKAKLPEKWSQNLSSNNKDF